ncbi:competence/damage-inducible protein A [Virgibacillus profundi]|uniref:Putative competence-damage inducible protein n=1 Tax=Virgibacillus profundi TaxID=2024555 RepID=A0A2A2IG02_9BACI|nr:competence/damage-inducible protein A [Virgibacillus profundi]PAV30070.1 competence/damage-inducible protein A [Virgibacillus profundi]PXY54243.1 competence/damage-inducible protein A [Virgibacillus profundi]
MRQYKAEIIAVGTELLLGQISNTNAQWLSQQLASYGINVYNHVVVGDNLKRVEETFALAESRSDIIIVTGGLGPTDDDLTREAFQSISELEIIEHPDSMGKIKHFFEKRKSVMTPNNRKQARVFKGSEVLENKVGMAPGMILTHNKSTWAFLPGVPREMKQLATDDVFPHLQKLTGNKDIIKSTVLKFIGIGESKLEHELKDIIKAQSNPTIAPLAQNDGVVIRLTAKDTSMEKADSLLEQTKQQILHRVGTFFYGVDDQTLEGQVITLLKQQNKQIAAAESLTGGLFMSKLISVEGASEVCSGGIVCYDTTVKENVLGVSKNTIQSKGTVSEECAVEMAVNVRKQLNSAIGISFTGVAGPGEVEGHPAGTVFIAISNHTGENLVEKFIFQGNRNTIRHRTVLKGLEILYKYLK